MTRVDWVCVAIAIASVTKKFYGIQFHPEVDLTTNGQVVFRNFLYDVCQLSPTFKIPNRIDHCISAIRDQVKERKILVSFGLWGTFGICVAGGVVDGEM